MHQWTNKKKKKKIPTSIPCRLQPLSEKRPHPQQINFYESSEDSSSSDENVQEVEIEETAPKDENLPKEVRNDVDNKEEKDDDNIIMREDLILNITQPIQLENIPQSFDNFNEPNSKKKIYEPKKIVLESSFHLKVLQLSTLCYHHSLLWKIFLLHLIQKRTNLLNNMLLEWLNI